MGQDFRAILSHQLKETELMELVQQLDRLTISLSDYLREACLHDISYPSAPSAWHWGWSKSNQPDLASWLMGESLSIAGIGSLSLDLGRHCVVLGCWVRWREFVTDKTIQKAMREITLRFVEFFKGELAIYLTGSSSLVGEEALNRVFDGASMAKIIEYLAQQQRPAITINSICKSETRLIGGKTHNTMECDGYYVDYFADIKEERSKA